MILSLPELESCDTERQITKVTREIKTNNHDPLCKNYSTDETASIAASLNLCQYQHPNLNSHNDSSLEIFNKSLVLIPTFLCSESLIAARTDWTYLLFKEANSNQFKPEFRHCVYKAFWCCS